MAESRNKLLQLEETSYKSTVKVPEAAMETETELQELQEPQSDDSHRLLSLKREMLELNQKMHVFRRPSMKVVCTLIFVFGFSEMLYLTPFITLTMDKVCEGLNQEQCDPKEVQMSLSSITSLNLIVAGTISTIMAGKWGQLSDRYGRVHVFCWMGAIRVVGNITHILSLSPLVKYNKWLIVFSSSVSSLSGGMFAFFGNVNSYIIDIVEPEERISSISIATGVMQITTAAGPMFGSFLVKWANGNDLVPIYAGLIAGLIFTISCFTIVVEPRHHEALKLSQSQFTQRRESLHGSYSAELLSTSTFLFKMCHHGKYHLSQLLELLLPLKHLWLKPTGRNKSLRPRYNVLLLLGIDMLFMGATMAIMPTLVLFCTYKYNWKSVELGYLISLSGILNAVMLFVESKFVMGWLKKIFTSTSKYSVDYLDKFTITCSLVFVSVGVATPLINNTYSMSILVFLVFRALGRICTPVTESAIVKYYKENQENTGQVFGAIALLNSLTMLVLPPIFLKIYSATISFKPEYFLYVPLAGSLFAYFVCSPTSY
ncbi:uncharacterized protein KNAG_0C01070 [Huiozyma naganishii CBS 8797]|uniref:Major facilitator superfamily (MFS) profile domain-containing protein n=1 Tax=Huiozyma naganishii (strain ATCC MYA-139 / BCRC 22969 / CBS 8797 / KCTC 17520 / NBRC 10181 / NCYC 3082 / Yp74L-3) TaxID=1071383 RepID=J7R311_HUIN7|nr:hypothetical protein KNAG_0C01070 [Kazachstania naganishii CBS 8797]CCK69220.1 hypothetical protein KNAG_0C01070 [Kazachstania naganishii CBS 8797]